RCRLRLGHDGLNAPMEQPQGLLIASTFATLPARVLAPVHRVVSSRISLIIFGGMKGHITALPS
ncbi:MAG: hypothetical protein AAFN63_08475, partial [Pseudomonadota bacterium]